VEAKQRVEDVKRLDAVCTQMQNEMEYGQKKENLEFPTEKCMMP
jgi:hypothetical protein